MLGLSPVSATPVAALFLGAAVAPSGTVRAADLPNREACWLLEVALPGGDGVPRPAPAGLVSGSPVAAFDQPVDTASSAPVVRVSDREWVGEPADSQQPNVRYAARLLEPPALERTFPIYPTAARRQARDTGEVILLNADGAMDALSSDWGLAGHSVTLLRGPHRRPRHADYGEFGRVAAFRAGAAYFAAGGRLRLPLTSAAADLSMAVCDTYAGTGGTEGPASMAGKSKPRLYGLRRNIEPVQVDSGPLLYQFHHGGRAAGVLDVRDRGVSWTTAGDYPSSEALAAQVLAGGTYATCLAEGFLRAGSTPSLLTMDARGDATGAYAGTAASIAERILRGPGGLDASRADAGDFSWPAGEVGLYLTGGTVQAAIEALATSVFGIWSADAFGRFLGRQLLTPEEQGVSVVIEPWMLAAPPEEAEAPSAPWYRVAVGYGQIGRVQSGEDFFGIVSAEARALYGRAYSTVAIDQQPTRLAYPAAVDGGTVVSGFDAEADATALAVRLMALFSAPRRAWTVRLGPNAGGIVWSALEPGSCVQLTWPHQAALRQGRPLIVRGISARGDNVTLDLWG